MIQPPDTTTFRSCIVARYDAKIGLIAFSKLTGLIYAVHPCDAEATVEWLAGRADNPPSAIYEETIGAGWAIPLISGRQIRPQLLPDQNAWSTLPGPEYPIAINWLITGRCPLACVYCWAEDLMRRDDLEPNREQIAQIADNILAFRPVTVILSGGDPLFSPFLKDAVTALSGKTGIVLDTSGYRMTDKQLDLFREHNVSVRISLDTDRPSSNEAQRPLYKLYPGFIKSGIGTTESAVSAICRCLDAGLTVTVQTVATKKTANDLLSLGDKLFRLGVGFWRVGKVAPTKARMEGYTLLVGSHSDKGKRLKPAEQSDPYDFVFKQLSQAHEQRWSSSMALQVMHNNAPNAVLLVSPDGVFYTESNVTPGKVVVDPRNPSRPDLSALASKVNMQAHAERYLNLTGLHR